MLNWIIKFLGGFTNYEYSLLGNENNQQRELISSYRAREEFLTNELKLEREDRKFLQDIIYKKFGVIASSEPSVTEETDLQPINSGTQSWFNLRNRMERDDKMRSQANG
jgi:hypothetical protein